MTPEQYNFLGCEAVILTALPVERLAVQAHLQDIQEIIHPQGTIYHQGRFSDKQRTWNVAVAEIGMGGPPAATETERAISLFRPQLAFFVGVAGGIKDVKIGDVVAATKVYNYEAGKAGLSFEPRPEVWHTSHALEQRARADAGKNNWLIRLGEDCPNPAPKAFVGPLAAGEKVISSKEAVAYKLIQANFGDALAVEMEGHGFLPSVHAHTTVHALIIRGISDLIDGKAQADVSGSQEQAARHAAAFTFEILANWVNPGTSPPTDMSVFGLRWHHIDGGQQHIVQQNLMYLTVAQLDRLLNELQWRANHIRGMEDQIVPELHQVNRRLDGHKQLAWGGVAAMVLTGGKEQGTWNLNTEALEMRKWELEARWNKIASDKARFSQLWQAVINERRRRDSNK